jgi:hypothetical protein
MNVLVTVDDQHRDQVEAIARQAKLAGMNVADVFPLGGVIAGEIAPADLDKLGAIEGIASVEEEPQFRTV